MPKNKHIFFVGRLEKEKGAEILLRTLEFSLTHKLPYTFTVIGEGSYFPRFSSFDTTRVHMLGKIPQKKVIDLLRKDADILFMPSLFLETFGLVALEALQSGVPVVGFRRGGLTDFIPKELALDEDNPVGSFFKILEQDSFMKKDISKYGYLQWQERLQEFTAGYTRIFCIHDYEEKIGGAEIYFHRFRDELKKLGKQVDSYTYQGKISSWKRWLYFFSTPFFFGKRKKLSERITLFHPDLIISHSVLRFIGLYGMRAVASSGIPHIMIHHDLGLVTPRPSQVFSLADIPDDGSWKSWKKHTSNPLEVFLSYYKWWMIRNIWKTLPAGTIHLLPSEWMIPIFQHYTNDPVLLFPHTVF